MAGFVRTNLRPLTGAGVIYDRRLSMAELVEFTRSVRFFLTSGLTLRDAMRVLSERGSRPVRGVGREHRSGSGSRVVARSRHRSPGEQVSAVIQGAGDRRRGDRKPARSDV